MSKQDMVTLIEAYSDAKAIGNKHLISIMVGQVERALDSIFDKPALEVDQDNA
jgi:hypothetical protein